MTVKEAKELSDAVGIRLDIARAISLVRNMIEKHTDNDQSKLEQVKMHLELAFDLITDEYDITIDRTRLCDEILKEQYDSIIPFAKIASECSKEDRW